MADQQLLPLPVTRLANTFLGLAMVVSSVAPAADGPWMITSGLTVAGVAAGLGLAVRGYRVGVRLHPDEIVVNGYLWTRRIKREQIRAVTDYPAIIWSSGTRTRWTPVSAFCTGRSLPPFKRRAEESVERLRTWVRHR